MSYVITDHNQQGFVILGPIDWKPRYISAVLSDEFDEEIVVSPADAQKVPYDILPYVKARKCISTYENINSKIEKLNGPYWTYDDTNPEYQAVAAWVKADKDIDFVKNELKAVAANERWKKENNGITLSIQNTQVWCDTSRANRGIYNQKYSSLNDGDTLNWKFGAIWLNITKIELKTMMDSVNNYIQSCFDWESEVSTSIDSCIDLASLDAIVIVSDTFNISANNSVISSVGA